MMGKEVVQNIREKMALVKLKQEAIEIPREDLEELWVDESYKMESKEWVNSGWRTYGFLTTLIAIFAILAIIMMTNDYEGTEFENYALIGQEICTEKEYGQYRYIQTTKGLININCKEGKITIPRN